MTGRTNLTLFGIVFAGIVLGALVFGKTDLPLFLFGVCGLMSGFYLGYQWRVLFPKEGPSQSKGGRLP